MRITQRPTAKTTGAEVAVRPSRKHREPVKLPRAVIAQIKRELARYFNDYEKELVAGLKQLRKQHGRPRSR
jgi:hypothetical protein